MRQQVLARSDTPDSFYSLECSVQPLADGLIGARDRLAADLESLVDPLRRLADLLRDQLADQADTLDTAARGRLEAIVRGLNRRARILIPAWQHMLASLENGPDSDLYDWFAIDRIDGQEFDVGMRRHWIDPTIPFAESVLIQAHGVAVTSATLRDRLVADGADEIAAEDAGWESAELRTGAQHLVQPAQRSFFPSPFNYAEQARILVVRDVDRSDRGAIAAAYRHLFEAAGGGGLGIFTSVQQLRAVHARIAEPLSEQGIALFAQHVDPIDTGTLVDVFRADEHACLLGTDAVRDGIDVPGASLRLIVFDRTPWPRPDLLHKVRRQHFGPRRYDDMLTRFRLQQAFGRLIRSAQDRGVFVILDSRLPTRLTTAFPDGVAVERVGLADAIAAVRDFLPRS